MKPLVVDPRFLRPLPKALFRSCCAKCDRRQAMWEMGPERGERIIVCSLCFLYESNWGKDRRAQVHELADAVEAESGEKFMRGADGRTLLSSRDGDRILGALALTSRMFSVQEKMQSVTQPTPELEAAKEEKLS